MKSIVKISCVLLVLLLPIIALGTAQYSDVIIYDGVVTSLYSNPLESFFEANPNRKPETEVISSANWRGYIATFEIIDSKLYVKDITIEKWTKIGNKTKQVSVIDDVFPEESDRFCTFYSGLLILLQGDLVNYTHLSYASLYEKYIVIGVFSGKTGISKSFTSEEYLEFQLRQFNIYRQTKDYAELFTRLMKPDSGDVEPPDSNRIESFMFEYNESYNSKYLLEEFK